MASAPTRIGARRITVHCPIAPETLAALASGDAAALARDPNSQPLLDFLESSPLLGRIGPYKSVCEVSLGLEAFTPLPGSKPAVGAAGVRSQVPMAAIATWLPEGLDAAGLDAILRELARLHPWETPVIEAAAVELFQAPPA